ncbi:hypothetical protein HMPREF1051_0619 [Neisseria sicca VK64]|uniref:Uncharacterized protein n=1 Tax=Neisseria sicca VK64 TaxID=1095748 RepID=I2NUZ5_NEISI|nr:hypothetical protein HMPREF1051_0619 [Neisseria sicca VK64]
MKRSQISIFQTTFVSTLIRQNKNPAGKRGFWDVSIKA